jgi:nucleoside-diphosphate-sugar epimerase
MKNILVFGKNGFLGKSFCHFLSKKKIKYNSYSSNEINLLEEKSSKKLRLIPKSIYKIIFFPALTPDKGKDEVTFIKNITMIKNFFAFFTKENIEHFFYISSDAVYSLEDEVITDKNIPKPQDLYGLMHLTREKIVQTHLPKEKISILRFTGIYGYGDTHNSYGPNRFIQSAIKENKIIIFGNGKDLRSHLYLKDAINYLYIIIKNKVNGVLCIASKKSYNFIYIAKLIKKLSENKNNNVDIIFKKNNNLVTKRSFKKLRIFSKIFPTINRDLKFNISETYKLNLVNKK